jgi:hypothetical protein
MSAIAERAATFRWPQMTAPRRGERWRCRKCGMEIQITADCKSTAGHHARFECCGQPLTKAG